MKILFLGDVVAAPGLRAARTYLEREGANYDVRIVNGENATGGFGLNRKHFLQLRDAGADVVTLGNHTFDQKETPELLEENARLVRALNYPPGTPGLGATTFETSAGTRITVAQVLGRLFMEPMDDPFRAVDALIEEVGTEHPIILDLHAEATSEKKVLGWHVAGRVAAAVGTHTHVQTADEQIVQGTAYMTDLGMTGVEASSIGMAFEEVHYRFTTKRPMRYRAATGRATVCGAAITVEGTRATAIERIRWTEPLDDTSS